MKNPLNERENTPRRRRTLPGDVVAQGLCVRCGACVGLCPKSLLFLDDRYYPVVHDAAHHCDLCGKCMAACPGHDVDIPGLSMDLFGKPGDYFDVLGKYSKALIGYSADEGVRKAGSSGGVVTQLLISLLQAGIIEKALVAGRYAPEPWKGHPVLADNEEQIIQCAQSKYTIVPQMQMLHALAHSQQPMAVVGLPCHIHALRKYQRRYPGKTSHVKLVIGLFCHMAIEIEGTEKMLECASISKDQVKGIEYRGGDWPGKVYALLKNGGKIPLHTADFKDGAINYLKYLYYPQRCLTCVDFSAEFADLSVGDPWFRRNDGGYLYEGGHSLLLVRTERAKEFTKLAQSRGQLKTEQFDAKLLLPRFSGMVAYKKIGAQVRIRDLKRKGRPYPHYHLSLPEPRRLSIIKERIHEFARILGRSRRGRNLGSWIAFSTLGDILTILRKFRKETMAHYQ